jgi:hypothetical protein
MQVSFSTAVYCIKCKFPELNPKSIKNSLWKCQSDGSIADFFSTYMYVSGLTVKLLKQVYNLFYIHFEA